MSKVIDDMSPVSMGQLIEAFTGGGEVSGVDAPELSEARVTLKQSTIEDLGKADGITEGASYKWKGSMAGDIASVDRAISERYKGIIDSVIPRLKKDRAKNVSAEFFSNGIGARASGYTEKGGWWIVTLSLGSGLKTRATLKFDPKDKSKKPFNSDDKISGGDKLTSQANAWIQVINSYV